MITHPEKVLFPDTEITDGSSGITKGELAAYYALVAPLMLPHIRGRPLTMQRFPRGIAAQSFWQKNLGKGTPDWLERAEVAKKKGTVCHPLINDRRALQWMANQNTITPHVWTSRLPDLLRPDVCVFDLDPAEDDASAVRRAALALRDLLDEIGVRAWVKTSGSKGFHLLVPLDAKSRHGEVFRFATAVGGLLVQRDPAHLTQEFSKVDREGRIFVDTGRNGYSATFAAPYAVRAKPGAPVSAPCTWEEIERGEVTPQSFALRSMPARIFAVGDLWSEMTSHPQPLKPAAVKLQRLLDG